MNHHKARVIIGWCGSAATCYQLLLSDSFANPTPSNYLETAGDSPAIRLGSHLELRVTQQKPRILDPYHPKPCSDLPLKKREPPSLAWKRRRGSNRRVAL